MASAVEYASFFESQATELEIVLLTAHALGGESSMGDLAPSIGHQEYSPVNIAYGNLGRRVAEALGLTPPSRRDGSPIRFAVLAEWRDQGSVTENQTASSNSLPSPFRSYLFEQVILGLHLAGHLSDSQLREALQRRFAAVGHSMPSSSNAPVVLRGQDPAILDADAARKHSITYMVSTARRSALASNGQTVDRILKNKELRCSEEELSELLVALVAKQKDRCAISQLPLQFHGTHDDDQMLPSLDRIDSMSHYERGNLQVVCRFVNKWKSDMPDGEFRRLLSILKGIDTVSE